MPDINHLSHQEYVALQRQRVKELAEQMIAGTLGVIEGSRRLAALSDEVEAEDESTFDIFRTIASEADTLPVGEVRQYWSVEALKIKDRERMSYEAKIKDSVMQACQKLVGS